MVPALSWAPGGQVGSVFRGTFVLDEPEFDWGAGYRRPAIPAQDLIIYEMGVRSFTADASAGLPAADAGTFRGLQAKARAESHSHRQRVLWLKTIGLFTYRPTPIARHVLLLLHPCRPWGAER